MSMRPPEVFNQQEQLELRLSSCAQQVLTRAECEEMQCARVYCVRATDRGVMSLSVQTKNGTVSKLEYGQHLYDPEAERELFYGYRMAFPSSHSAYWNDLGHRTSRPVQIIEIDDNELPRGALLNETLVEEIEEHVEIGQMVHLSDPSPTYMDRLQSGKKQLIASISNIEAKARTVGWQYIPRAIGALASTRTIGRIMFRRHP